MQQFGSKELRDEVQAREVNFNKRGQSDLAKDESGIIRDILAECSSRGVNIICDLSASLARSTVVLCNPELVNVLVDVDKWRSSKITTLYLFGETDEQLQTAIKELVLSSKGKLSLRLFSRVLPLAGSLQGSFFGGWTQVLSPDDRSPPFKRLMICAFKLGKLSRDQREEFLDKVRHDVADLVVFEHIGEGFLRIDEWIALFKRYSGIPGERAMVMSSDGSGFGMVVRFYHQGEQEERIFMRKGASDGDIPHLGKLM